ncbi:hypothetical protein [Stratiformator vulcanicus]|uniref:Uncharacterized protein n=1 Tax=Stratiformator vulcanicus TaxID=2527980 RepID=A0A517R6W5_9PLAN|nr:hypothetical protein [Stratiformator vulcanicus]QDT39619.1 hypothetical protein Pan189_40280 [Stratiformator vulcanicus]
MNASDSPDDGGSRALGIANKIIGGSMLALLALYIYGFYIAESSIPIDKVELAKAIQERLAENPEVIAAEMASLVAETAPPVAEAMRVQFQKDFEKYQEVAKEQAVELAQEVSVDLREEVKQQYAVFLTENRGILRAQFPGRNIDRLTAELQYGFNRLVDKYRVEEFAERTARTAEIWSLIKPIEQPAIGEPDLEVQLADYLLDWAVLRVKDVSFSGADIDLNSTWR